MKQFSIENIKHLYGWLDENPNNAMHKIGYSVIVFDCFDTLDTNPEYGCGFRVREHIFGTKEEAWFFFQQDLCYGRRDFWDEVAWTDECVVSTLYDEGGWTHVWIEKWDGFDEDIEFTWEYNGIKYKTPQDLWEAVPIFKGNYMSTDHPCISAFDEETNTWQYAHLNIELSDSFYASCEKKKKELKEEEEERERLRKEREKDVIEIDPNNTDLPF